MSNDVKSLIRSMINEIVDKVFVNSKKFEVDLKELEEKEEDDYFDYSAIDRRRITKNSQYVIVSLI